MEWLADRFELSRGAAGNVRTMEGLRGFAVLLVFFVHYVSLIEPWLLQRSTSAVIASSIMKIGYTGVDLFFVLSGYLIYGMLILRPQPFRRFMLRRVVRIYPTFVAVFIIYVVGSFVFPSESKIPGSLREGLIYLLQNFLLLPGLFPITPMITVAWSLSYEMFFYLLIPVLIGVLGLRRWRPKWRVALFGAIAAVIGVHSLIFGGYLPFLMFISGILLYETVNQRLVTTTGDLAALSFLAGGLLFMLVPIEGRIGYTIRAFVLFVSFFVLCHACFTRPSSYAARIFSWTPVRWLGNMSYSYYLMHGLVLKAFFLGFAFVLPPSGGSSAIFWLLLAPAFATTIVVSAILFLVVERPFSIAPALSRQSADSASLQIVPVDLLTATPESPSRAGDTRRDAPR